MSWNTSCWYRNESVESCWWIYLVLDQDVRIWRVVCKNDWSASDMPPTKNWKNMENGLFVSNSFPSPPYPSKLCPTNRTCITHESKIDSTIASNSSTGITPLHLFSNPRWWCVYSGVTYWYTQFWPRKDEISGTRISSSMNDCTTQPLICWQATY